jgi:hypothetical protein
MKYAIERRPLFPLGQLVATPSALAALQKAGQSPAEFLSLHVRGQWGDRAPGHQALVDLLLCRKLLDPREVVGASGFEPPSSWSRTSMSKIPKPSSWRHLRDSGQQKIPLRFATIRNRPQ